MPLKMNGTESAAYVSAMPYARDERRLEHERNREVRQIAGDDRDGKARRIRTPGCGSHAPGTNQAGRRNTATAPTAIPNIVTEIATKAKW